MLKLLGGSGGGGNGDGKARWQGKSFQIEKYSVTVEDTIAEGIPTYHQVGTESCLSVEKTPVYTVGLRQSTV